MLGTIVAEGQMGKISLKGDGENCQLIYSDFPKYSLLSKVRYLVEERNRLRLKNFHSACFKLGLTMDVVVSDAVVARVGTQTQPGPLSKLLALGPIELRFLPLLASSLRGHKNKERVQAPS